MSRAKNGWVVERIQGRHPQYYGHKGKLFAVDEIDARNAAVRLYVAHVLKKEHNTRGKESGAALLVGFCIEYVLLEENRKERLLMQGPIRSFDVAAVLNLPKPELKSI